MVQTLENHEPIYNEMRKGLALLKSGDQGNAEQCILQAWKMIPDPQYNWDISQIVVIRIAKFFRDIKKFAEAEQWAQNIFKCNPAPGDAEPYIVLGSIYLESGDLMAARENLQKAFDLAGKRGFQGHDPKYLKFLKDKNQPNLLLKTSQR